MADEKLGATEVVNEAVLKTLNLDDFVYRRFERSGGHFTVYAAYWAPGRMPTRLVASHTPDRCWTENGMRCVEMKFRQEFELAEKRLMPAEYRVFTAGGAEAQRGGLPAVGSAKAGGAEVQRSGGTGEKGNGATRPNGGRFVGGIHVLYWHTVEGRPYDYGARFNAMPHPWLWWKDTIVQAAFGSREQLFVRIASETPLEDLWRDEGFQTVMTKVADLGLWAQ